MERAVRWMGRNMVKHGHFSRLQIILLTFALLVTGMVLAHATVVFGTISTVPEVPQPGEPFLLRLELVDQTQLPVEDAFVIAEFRPQGSNEDAEPVASADLAEIGAETGDAGIYEATLTLPQPGAYTLLLRDQTFRQEEGRQSTLINVGSPTPTDALTVIFPPTATQSSVSTWLYWLIGVPLFAAVVVTVLVLRSPPAEAEA